MAEILQGGKRDLTGQTSSFTITNSAPYYSLSATNTTAASGAQVLATLIRDLIVRGVVNGTVA